jgi:hypothetical protein
VRLAIFENVLGKIAYPFVLRRIEINEINLNLYDIVTPYGYGGPCIKGEINIIETFRNLFEGYCKDQNIVSEVIRFHPLLNNHIPMLDYIDVQYIRKTTAVNLNNDIKIIRTQYNSMTRRNISKAEKNGVYCLEVEKSESNINTFVSLYTETMSRNNALGYYYFDKEIITDMLKDSNSSSAHLLFAYFENRVVSAVVLYLCGENAHYHLGASKTEYFYLKSNNKLFDFMISFSKIKNAKNLHLGGGYSENDGLFSFKSSFTNNNHYDYFLGKKILNDEIYEILITYFSRQNTLSHSYFPKYRGIVEI